MADARTQFKVGGRVRFIHDGDEGTITEIAGNRVYVEWEADGLEDVHVTDVEPVEEQPNRTYYEAQDRDYEQEEPPLAPWERGLIGTPFEQNVHRILDSVADTVIKKNASYGDSALNPIRVFSKADRMEQLFVRLDDKLSRVQRGSEYPGDDTLRDIIGYATLILIARESE